jgi:two-component system response regulator FlrC
MSSTVLFVDDDLDVQEVMQLQIERAGYRALVASSAGEALRLLKEAPVTAVLSDIQMGEVSGIDLLKKAQANGFRQPFAFLTGFGSPESIIEAVRLGAVDFLLKPHKPEELQSVLHRLVEIGRKTEEIEEMLDALGEGVAPQTRAAIESLRRQIAWLRVLGSAPRVA